MNKKTVLVVLAVFICVIIISIYVNQANKEINTTFEADITRKYNSYENIEVDAYYPSTFEEQDKFQNGESLVYLVPNENIEDAYNYPNPQSGSETFSITDATVVKTINGKDVATEIKLLTYTNYDKDTDSLLTVEQNPLLSTNSYVAYISNNDNEGFNYLRDIGVPVEQLTNLYAIKNGHVGIVDLGSKHINEFGKEILKNYEDEIAEIEQVNKTKIKSLELN